MKALDRATLIDFWINEIETSMPNGDFQRDRFESLHDQWVAKKNLTNKQYESLKSMYERVTG